MRRDRRGRMGEAVLNQEPTVRPADERQDRGEGHQPLRRRSAEGVPGAVVAYRGLFPDSIGNSLNALPLRLR